MSDNPSQQGVDSAIRGEVFTYNQNQTVEENSRRQQAQREEQERQDKARRGEY